MDDMKNFDEIVHFTKKVAIEAGKRILEVYNQPDFEVRLKSDNSPITEADKVANEFILEQLQKYYPDFGILTEESKFDNDRLQKSLVWIIDPLDGTKEFIKRNGEFTVNIGLVEDGVPCVGVVYVPVKKDLYYAVKNNSAYVQHDGGVVTQIHCSSNAEIEQMILVKSRSHAGEKLNRLLQKYHFAAVKESGSSIKICMIARGLAEVYFRFGPTNEWDICAAHCVINEAGGKLTDCIGKTIHYNKPDPLNRNGFIASNNAIHPQLVKVAKEQIPPSN